MNNVGARALYFTAREELTHVEALASGRRHATPPTETRKSLSAPRVGRRRENVDQAQSNAI